METPKPETPAQVRLREALRRARIESAERSAVIVDLHDAEVARLEVLNDALDSLFEQIPPGVDLFDRGISRGDPPRLWLDMVAYVVMGRDKRTYRFLQDSRYGPKVLAESAKTDEIVDAVTTYVARRIIERDRALATDGMLASDDRSKRIGFGRGDVWRAAGFLALGIAVGVVAVLAAAWIAASRL
jgi:hypothetical protein